MLCHRIFTEPRTSAPEGLAAFSSNAMHSGKSWSMEQCILDNYDAFWEKVVDSRIHPTFSRIHNMLLLARAIRDVFPPSHNPTRFRGSLHKNNSSCFLPRLTQQNQHCDWLILGHVPLIKFRCIPIGIQFRSSCPRRIQEHLFVCLFALLRLLKGKSKYITKQRN